jgi:hypothetical protein
VNIKNKFRKVVGVLAICFLVLFITQGLAAGRTIVDLLILGDVPGTKMKINYYVLVYTIVILASVYAMYILQKRARNILKTKIIHPDPKNISV